MPTRPDHREVLTRRLELLRAELDPDGVPPPAGADPWSGPSWESPPVQELAPDPPPGSGAPPVPVPGRHAARRLSSAGGWARGAAGALPRAVPETLRGRAALAPWHLTVLALLVAGGLAVTCWWIMRGDPVVAPVASSAATPLVSAAALPTSPRPSGAAPAAAAPARSGGSPAAAGTVTVDVAGKVRHPGVLELPAGSRVVDALEAAGGVRPHTDLTGLNRARVLVDGEQIVVGGAAGAGAARSTGSSDATVPAGPGGAAAGPGALVNLNTATLDELDTLPDVGPVTAQAILDYRAEHGGFGSVEELLDIEGIGEKTLADISPHVTV